jgi:hypothetical protein
LTALSPPSKVKPAALTHSIGPAAEDAAKAAKSSALNAERQFKISEQPYLSEDGVAGPERQALQFSNEKMPVFFYFKNTGRSTAKDIHVWIAAAFGGGPLRRITNLPAERREPVDIGAGGTFAASVGIGPFTSQELGWLKTGQWHVWILATGYYRDFSGRKFPIQACDVTDPGSGTFMTCSEPHRLVVAPAIKLKN